MKDRVGLGKVNNLLFVTKLTLWSDVSSLVQGHTLETHTEPKVRIKIEIFCLKEMTAIIMLMMRRRRRRRRRRRKRGRRGGGNRVRRRVPQKPPVVFTVQPITIF